MARIVLAIAFWLAVILSTFEKIVEAWLMYTELDHWKIAECGRTACSLVQSICQTRAGAYVECSLFNHTFGIGGLSGLRSILLNVPGCTPEMIPCYYDIRAPIDTFTLILPDSFFIQVLPIIWGIIRLWMAYTAVAVAYIALGYR